MRIEHTQNADLLHVRLGPRPQEVTNRRVSDDIVADLGAGERVVGLVGRLDNPVDAAPDRGGMPFSPAALPEEATYLELKRSPASELSAFSQEPSQEKNQERAL